MVHSGPRGAEILRVVGSIFDGFLLFPGLKVFNLWFLIGYLITVGLHLAYLPPWGLVLRVKLEVGQLFGLFLNFWSVF